MISAARAGSQPLLCKHGAFWACTSYCRRQYQVREGYEATPERCITTTATTDPATTATATHPTAAHLLDMEDNVLLSPYLARILWVVYEICLSYSILVTVIVTYALIPLAKKRAPKVRSPPEAQPLSLHP